MKVHKKTVILPNRKKRAETSALSQHITFVISFSYSYADFFCLDKV